MWWLSSRRPGYSYYQNIVFVSEFGIFFILCSLQSFMAIVAKEIPAKFWFLKTAYMHHNNYSENKFFSKDCHLVLGYCCQKSLVILPCHHRIRHHRLACKIYAQKDPPAIESITQCVELVEFLWGLCVRGECVLFVKMHEHLVIFISTLSRTHAFSLLHKHPHE